MGEIEKSKNNKLVNMIQQSTPVDPTEEEKTELAASTLSIFNNMSAVYVKQEKYKKAIEFASKSLEIDPTNIKALFRRGKSYLAINEVENAEKDLEQANELAGGSDNSIKRELV